MTSDRWWYLISMTALGLSLGVMLSSQNTTLTVLALLNAAFWGLSSFSYATNIREKADIQHSDWWRQPD